MSSVVLQPAGPGGLDLQRTAAGEGGQRAQRGGAALEHGMAPSPQKRYLLVHRLGPAYAAYSQVEKPVSSVVSHRSCDVRDSSKTTVPSEHLLYGNEVR